MKKLIAAVTTAIFAVALVVVGAAAPASAHVPDLQGIATCDTSTGTWSIDWHYSIGHVTTTGQSDTKVTASTPTGTTFSSSQGAVIGGVLVLSTTAADQARYPGVPVKVGDWSTTFTQSGIPASVQTASVTVVNAHWTDTQYDTTKAATVTFDGTCAPNDGSSAAAVHTSAPTCEAPSTLVLETPTNAKWGTPVYSGTSYSVVATAISPHTFPSGTGVNADHTTKTFTGSLAPQLSGAYCVTTPDASASVSVTPATCSAPASLVYGTTSNASFTGGTPNGATGPLSYTVTATATAHHAFSTGLPTETFTGSLGGIIPPQTTNPNGACYTPPAPVPAPAAPAFTDVCGTASDTFSLPVVGADDHFTYRVSDTTTNGVRTVVVTAIADSGYGFPAGATTEWSHTFTDALCQVIAAEPLASACGVTNADTELTDWVFVDQIEHVTYSIYPAGHPELLKPLTEKYTGETAGRYVVIADAAPGFTLAATATHAAGTHREWTIDVEDALICTLPTDATWHAAAAGHSATCADGTAQSGYITLTHLADETGKVDYSLGNDATGTSKNLGNTTTRVSVAPGHYTVVAKAHDAGDGLSTASVFHITVASVMITCADGTSTASAGGAGAGDAGGAGGAGLAFTGVDPSLPLGLAGGMLVLGLAGIFLGRRYVRRSAK
jgi:hypothetical protein